MLANDYGGMKSKAISRERTMYLLLNMVVTTNRKAASA